MPELNIVEKVIALEAVELLQKLGPEQLARIGSIAREVKVPPQTVVLEPSKPGWIPSVSGTRKLVPANTTEEMR